MPEPQSEPSPTAPSPSKRKKILRFLGISALALFTLGIVGILLSLFTSGRVAPGKDSIVFELNNLFANAYQYRIRPSSMNGGGGVYTGYKIFPASLSKGKEGSYTANVLHPDTIQFLAVWVEDSSVTIFVKIGPDAKPITNSWIQTGSFQD